MAPDKKTRITAAIVDDHAIYHAIWREDKQWLDQLIDEDPSALAVSSSKWDGTPLIYAILFTEDEGNENGDEMALHIIQHKPQQYWDVVTETSDNSNLSFKGMTPLQAACWAEAPEIVKALVERGADPTECNLETGHTPLNLIVRRNSREAEDILEYLLSFPPVLDTLDHPVETVEDFTTTVLGVACTKATPFMVEILLNAGADPTDGGDEWGKSALEAIRYEKDKIIQSRYLCSEYKQDEIKKLDEVNQMLLESIDKSVRARLLFKVRFVADAAKAVTAVSQDARKRGVTGHQQRKQTFDATPECLERRFQVSGPMPSVRYNDPAPSWLETQCACGCGWIVAPCNEDDDNKKAYTVLRLAVDELPDDLFDDLVEMMVPPGDLAWYGEELGYFLGRLQYGR